MARLPALKSRLACVAPIVATPSPTARSGFVREGNQSSTQRGYGADWRKVRAAVLAVHPLCAECDRKGRVTVATDVHHKERFRGTDDPRRLDPSNLEPLCRPCHMAHTGRDGAGVAG